MDSSCHESWDAVHRSVFPPHAHAQRNGRDGAGCAGPPPASTRQAAAQGVMCPCKLQARCSTRHADQAHHAFPPARLAFPSDMQAPAPCSSQNECCYHRRTKKAILPTAHVLQSPFAESDVSQPWGELSSRSSDAQSILIIFIHILILVAYCHHQYLPSAKYHIISEVVFGP